MSEQVYSGRIVNVMYSQNDFHIAKVVTDEGKELPVKGNFPLQTIVPGTWVSFAGEWTEHPKYGRQLTVTRSPVTNGKWDDAKVDSVLSSNGVGPQLRLQVKVLANSKGVSLADLLNSGDLTGLGSDQVTQQFVISRWNSIRVLFEASHFLSEAGVPTKVAGKVWSVLGEKLEESITSDPWVLVRVAGISFKEADEVAVRLGIPITNEGRLNGAVLTAIRDVASEGHVYATTGQIVSAIGQMIQGTPIPTLDVANSIKRLKDQNQIAVERGYGGVTALYEPWTEHMESYCAESLYNRVHTASKGDFSCSEEDAREELSKWATGRRVTLTETQIKAAVNCISEPVSILTGLPGTGKTTTLQAVVSVLRDKSVPFLLVAPTGIAAKRLASVTGANAATVHRAFSAQGFNTDEDRESAYEGVVGESSSGRSSNTQGEDWGYGPDNPHPAQVIIIDESSMLDLHMLYRLLQGTSNTCRMVFVGDPYQLPSVGAGDVLRDLVNTKRFPHTHLSEIFRQEDTSGIVVAAHSVHRGITPNVDGSDFMLIPSNDEGVAADIIRRLAVKLHSKRENFQVLSPRHMGDAGVTSLNEILRLSLNPPSPGIGERRIGNSVVREGDRIMVVKNDYRNGVYNGDIGKISRIDHRSKELEIRIYSAPDVPEQEVRYDYTKGSPPIRLAYAQTIHKSQGQEYNTIIVPVLKSFGRQLQRNLLYTAITRAKKRVILVGEVEAITKAVQNDMSENRNTLLSHRISEHFERGGSS